MDVASESDVRITFYGGRDVKGRPKVGRTLNEFTFYGGRDVKGRPKVGRTLNVLGRNATYYGRPLPSGNVHILNFTNTF